MALEHYIGLMSGTSMDSIDAALISISDNAINLVASHKHPWPTDLRQLLRLYAGGQPISLRELGRLDGLVAEQFAASALAAIASSGLATHQIRAIGSHGQTLCHYPDDTPAYSLQIGNPNLIAERTGITTVADFRRRDLAAGGQGAPLVPAFHQALFSQTDKSRVVLNIGGIANISLLRGNDSEVIGFDTGPGNCLMDAWTRKHLGQDYDKDAELAAAGTMIPELLGRWLQDPYFSRSAPKSTGTEYFSLDWLMPQLDPTHSVADVQRTLLELTAVSIADQISMTAAAEVLVCGGGVHNPLLMQRLSDLLSMPVRSTADYGVHPDWVEAQAFAWLASRTLNGLAGNLPSVTGAGRAAILGGIYPA